MSEIQSTSTQPKFKIKMGRQWPNKCHSHTIGRLGAVKENQTDLLVITWKSVHNILTVNSKKISCRKTVQLDLGEKEKLSIDMTCKHRKKCGAPGRTSWPLASGVGAGGGRGEFHCIYFYTGGLSYSRNFVNRKPNDILNLYLSKNDIKILTM